MFIHVIVTFLVKASLRFLEYDRKVVISLSLFSLFLKRFPPQSSEHQNLFVVF